MVNNEILIKNETIVSPSYISRIKNTKNNYSSLLLKRLVDKGSLRRVKKGKYTSSINIYALASNLVFPSYISFWSGIEYKGKTEQILNTIFIACTKKTRDINFEKYSIRFIKLSKKNFFGYKKERTNNEEIFIADNEKLLIDCILFPKYSGNLDEVIKLIESTNFDKEKILKYLEIINNKSLNQRIGFLLEKYKGIDLELKIKTKNYVYIPLRNERKIDKKWGVRFNDI